MQQIIGLYVFTWLYYRKMRRYKCVYTQHNTMIEKC